MQEVTFDVMQYQLIAGWSATGGTGVDQFLLQATSNKFLSMLSGSIGSHLLSWELLNTRVAASHIITRESHVAKQPDALFGTVKLSLCFAR